MAIALCLRINRFFTLTVCVATDAPTCCLLLRQGPGGVTPLDRVASARLAAVALADDQHWYTIDLVP
jgi:hypothetical protein